MGPGPSVFDPLANLTGCLQTCRRADFVPQTSGRTLVSGLQPEGTHRDQNNWGGDKIVEKSGWFSKHMASFSNALNS